MNQELRIKKKIHNSLFIIHNSSSWKGFTLIELLVTVAIMGMIILGANNLFFYTLKGGKKTDVISKIKQNGSYALSSMANRIRNAASLSASDCQANKLTIKTLEGDSIIYQITAGQIASNGSALTSSDVVAEGLNFSCPLPIGDAPPTVVISFTLKKTGSMEETASETFQTTVSLRNY